VITAEETFPNLLRAAATLIRIPHGLDCAARTEHHEAAAVLDAAAATVEAGGLLTGRELTRVEEIVRIYKPAEVPA
jgi:hypothetical protein